MNVAQKRLADTVCRLTGVNVFENSRKREIVEARGLLNWIYRRVCGLTYNAITRIYKSQGKNYDHTTALHSIKNYEMYEKYNPTLYEIRMLVMASDRTATTTIRKDFIKENIEHMKSEVVENVYEIIYENYR
jgi:hypothetical protein